MKKCALLTFRAVLFFAVSLAFLSTTAFSATIVLSQTGQTECYTQAGALTDCAGTGQDGEYLMGIAWPNPRFSAGTGAGADCITDNLTGLMWPRNANLTAVPLKWNAAIDYANTLTLCGFDDWRLPNINELESIIHGGQSNTETWLITEGFTNTQTSWYWTSTTYAAQTNNAWLVDIRTGYEHGDVRLDSGLNSYSVWPVRTDTTVTNPPAALWKTGQSVSYRAGDDGDHKTGIDWPSPRFEVGTGVEADCVVDNLTGLMWSKNAYPYNTKDTWQGVLGYANGLTLCGYTDWRLPNRKELTSLVDRSQHDPALPAGHPFTNVEPGGYWTSSTAADSFTYAWLVSMPDGYVHEGGKSGGYSVWPVRGGQSTPSGQLTLSIVKAGAGAGAVASEPAGLDCGASCTGQSAGFASGAGVTLTATADENSAFVYWSGACSGDSNPCHLALTADMTVTAYFVPLAAKKVNLNTSKVAKNAGKGTITSDDGFILCGTGKGCSAKYYPGSPVTLTAEALPGSTFTGWQSATVSCPGTDPCALILDKTTSVKAVFIGDYMLKVVSKSQKVKGVGGSGTVTYGTAISCSTSSKLNCSTKVAYDTAVTLTANPDAGSQLKSWTGCPNPDLVNKTCSLTMGKAYTVTATFVPAGE